jgi:hypothetical protein
MTMPLFIFARRRDIEIEAGFGCYEQVRRDTKSLRAPLSASKAGAIPSASLISNMAGSTPRVRAAAELCQIPA